MLRTLWSVKGGSGATVVAAGMGVALAQRSEQVLLVDLAGDLPATLGMPEPAGPGVRDWLAAPDSSPAAIERLVVPVDENVSVLPRGVSTGWPAGRAAELLTALTSTGRAVVVDAGTWPEGLGGDEVPEPEHAALVLASALASGGSSLLVIRSCYLALRRATAAHVRSDGVVVVVEPGRALGADAITQVLGSPVLATLQVDPAVARAVDAGILARRAPRALLRSIGPLL